jgi:translation initiation factor 2 subunit 2
MESYEDMLKKARSELPEDIGKGERFVVPKVIGHIQGNKTVISNFIQIAQTIGRPVEHLLKYINREMAAMGEIKKTLAIFNTKLSANKMNEKIQAYVDNFVICRTCGRPDTKLHKESSVTIMTCQACGARQSITSKI